MPCMELFDAQDEAYRETVLGGRRHGARVGRGGIDLRLGALLGLHGLRRHRPLRRVGPGRRPLRAFRPHRRGDRGSSASAQQITEEDMTVRVAINGFGRIGRLVAARHPRAARHGLELVAINDLAEAKANALLFKLRQRPRPLPRRGQGRRRHDRCRQRQAHQGHRRARSRQAAAQGAGRRASRWNAPASSPTEKAAKPSRRRRQARADLGPGQGRRPDRRLRRQPRQADRRAHRSSPTPPARPTAWRRSPRC